VSSLGTPRRPHALSAPEKPSVVIRPAHGWVHAHMNCAHPTLLLSPTNPAAAIVRTAASGYLERRQDGKERHPATSRGDVNMYPRVMTLS
jgi:hypothetical protein